MGLLDRFVANLRRTLGEGLRRKPQEFLYLDHQALYEHYKAETGMSRVPLSVSESLGAQGGASLLGLELGASGGTSTSFDISEPHLFESLEPVLRERYPTVASEADAVASLRNFAWFKGSLSWLHVGPTRSGEQIVEEARLFHTLQVGDLPFCLACDASSFSPFMPFMVRDPQFYHYAFEVETLAYNAGVLAKYGSNVHPKSGRSLVLVPTVILASDDRTNDEIAEWLRGLNDGELSRPWGMRREPKK